MSVMTISTGLGITHINGQSIPFGCICSYTWGSGQPGMPLIVRNGAMKSCPADHESCGV